MADAILDRLASRPEFVEVVEEMLASEGRESTGGTTRTGVGAGGIERDKRQGAPAAW